MNNNDPLNSTSILLSGEETESWNTTTIIKDVMEVHIS